MHRQCHRGTAFVAFAILTGSGCVVGGGPHGGGRYEFELSTAKANEVSKPTYLVLEEVSHVDEHVDGMPSGRLLRASLRMSGEWPLKCTVPSLRLSPMVCIIPPLVSWWDEQYRFTVFAPGFRAETIYPETGYDHNRPDEPPPKQRVEQNCPGRLTNVSWIFSASTSVHDAIPMHCERDHGVVRCSLSLVPLDSKLSSADAETFAYQLSSLRKAIDHGRLNLPPGTARRELMSTLHTEREALSPQILEVDGTFRLAHPEYEGPSMPGLKRGIEEAMDVIEKWAGVEARSPE